MSNTFIPIRLPLSAVRALIGCRNEEALAHHTKNLRKHLREIDDLLEEHDDSLGDPESPEPDRLDLQLAEIKKRMAKGESVQADIESFISGAVMAFQQDEPAKTKKATSQQSLPDAKTVLHHIFFGESIDARVGFAYDMVIGALCEKVGTKLPNQNWIGMKHIDSWFAELDTHLVNRGVSPELFSMSKHLLSRGNPLVKTSSRDLPSVGYLTIDEIAQISPLLDELHLEDKGPEDPETYLMDIREWMRTCLAEDEDFICFTY